MRNIEFISKVRGLIGKSYSECDCACVVRKPLGIQFSGTNWLFRSINNSPKYRYLKELHNCGDGTIPPLGAVVFKTDGTRTPKGYDTPPDAYHCGVVDEDGYVIHSSPKTGVRKDMTSKWSQWKYWGLMKQVEYTNEGVSDLYDEGEDADYEPDGVYDPLKVMTDRELLEAIYKSVVKD